MAPLLQIVDVPAGSAGERRVELIWQEGAERRVAVSVFAVPGGEGDAERIRWYLEDYAEFSADPAPAIAREAEAKLAQAGTDLFGRVFSSPDAAGIWERARDGLGAVRVEVDTDPGEGPDLAWELLREPGANAPVALGAGSFVRAHLQAAGHPDLPEPAGDRLRVLLVIARPGGRADVPFRSVASRLVRGGAGQMEGLDLDVLRPGPASFARLSEVLHAAHDAGHPYHVVHFDGHGSWLDLADLSSELASEGSGGAAAPPHDSRGSGGFSVTPFMYGVSVAGPVRPGPHGYLLFEGPGHEENQQLVDGPTVGRLLTATGVPVLVLNACRSGYTEVPGQPGDSPRSASGGGDVRPSPDHPQNGLDAANAALTGDAHARVQAYGSLAAEVADAGVPGVVAMRYNVYVVTAAQFVADMYAHLLAGDSLGEAVAAARRALAADPVRQVGAVAVALQDWVVPVVYESAPLVLLRSPKRAVPLIKVTPAETRTDDGMRAGWVPGPPCAGFFGRDETLLALDRTFDTQHIVLLHAYAGAGKSDTAAEFARWYQATGGLDNPAHPEWGQGVILWSSFEHHLTADRVIGTAGDFFAGLLKANGIAWAAVTSPAQRRDLVMQILAQVRLLWIWDNVEPVTGFPPGTPSDWTPGEQDDLLRLLRDLAQHSGCKVLLTSRRHEHTWLRDLPARVRLPPMPMRESLQLAAAIAARRGRNMAGPDWRPLLHYAAGNPLAITVLAGQALRDNLATTAALENFVARLRAAEAQLEAWEDAALASRSLAASLSYGFATAFTDAERVQLAVLHLFRDTVEVDALRDMGDPLKADEDAVPELAGLTRETGIALLDRAAGIGLLESIGTGYYQIHPALPWYFTALFTASYGPPGHPAARRAARAYATAMGNLGEGYHFRAGEGLAAQIIGALRAEEVNLRHALDLARSEELWGAAVGCLQGLLILYERTGRDSEWARLVAVITPDFTDPATGGPLPGRGKDWNIVTGYRMRLARDNRDWPAATALQNAVIAWNRDRAAAGLAAPTLSLTDDQANQIRNLAVSLHDLGNILRAQEDPGCLRHHQEALTLFQRIGDRAAEATVAFNLGNAYLRVPRLRDPDQAGHWFQASLSLRPDHDRIGRANCHGQLGAVALQQFDDARAVGKAETILLEHLDTALRGYQQALDLDHPDDHESRAITEHQLGVVYRRLGDTRNALRHYQQAIHQHEAQSDIYNAGQTRENIARLLAGDGRFNDALLYARAALHNYQQVGPGAVENADDVWQLIAALARAAEPGWRPTASSANAATSPAAARNRRSLSRLWWRRG